MLTALALDATARTIDTDGRMHINRSHISKVGVNPYYGREIPGWDALGLDPSRVYNLWRSADELEKAAPTFARNPILCQHIPVSSANPQTEMIVGAIGSDVAFNDPYLDADLVFWDDKAIAGIETDTLRELSAAYHYLPVMIEGEYNGQKFDGMMTQIRGNHLATVETGRAGSDVLAADSALEIPPMAMTKLGKLIHLAVPKLAQDATLSAEMGGLTKFTSAHKAKLIAMDATVDPDAMDAMVDDDEDETPAEKAARLKREKEAAEDEDETDEEKKAREKPAMDAAIATALADLREANDARIAVRPVVGDVVAMDSAAEIYGFALTQMKVPHDGVTDVAGRRALFNLAQSRTVETVPAVAMDYASVSAKFPNANRFSQA